ncbi:hypothetical protein K2173_025304 [Erythroxylum novogranatense]|uniref:Mediator complex subunit Med12 domain-containing protein n=1 Tax=Erythroxylum novogranatense TaxID=1862640 RepID=A0AAV8UGV4_9ROSI|nr:hypothetical protein K2173_025304 [Erythroxylum novogranatense]
MQQRYHPSSAINNSAIGGPPARDNVRADSTSLPAAFSINSRRPPPLTPYRLKCDKEPLNSRLGPPDFHPQTPNCPEETLTGDYAQSGYKETIGGLEESREILQTQVQGFSRPAIIKCREAIRKCLRAINDSRAQKRKAGQVYGVPLSGSLLTKPAVFPDQRPCSEDLKKKWIEGLSQSHKQLHSLAEYVPHGYRRKSLFEVLIRNNVPLLRATWFIKVTYLNQVRPSSTGISSGALDKTQVSRTELWTKDVVEYLQYLLDEFLSRNNSHSVPHARSSHMVYSGSILSKSDPSSMALDTEEPSLHFKWWYVVRLLHWHYAEGLLLPSVIIDWVLNQLQEKDFLEILQLLLPIIYGVLETVVLSQTYVKTLASIAIRFIREPSPGGSDLVDNSRRAYTTSALIELLRYLILAVPDSFVALDCFPLPSSVVSYAINDGAFVSKGSDEARKTRDNSVETAWGFRFKGLDAQYQSLSFNQVVSSIQKRADNLTKAASPSYPVHSVAKAVHALDEALLSGDIRGAYNLLFENFCHGAVVEGWFEEVSPCLRSSLKWIGTVSLSFVCSVFFLCEWATCDYRDFRMSFPYDLKFTGRNFFCHVYVASWVLKLKLRNLQSLCRRKNDRSDRANCIAKGLDHQKHFGRVPRRNHSLGDIFESPGPLHDIIVCWIDQHDVHKGEGLKRLQLLVVELVRSGIFYPQSYVRQLIVSGIMDTSGPIADIARRRRHYQILKELPGHLVRDVLEEAGIVEGSQLVEAMHVYSNERLLILRGCLFEQSPNSQRSNISTKKQKNRSTSGKGYLSSASFDIWKSSSNILNSNKVKVNPDVDELKASISLLLQLPNCLTSSEIRVDESQGSLKRSAESTCSKVDLVEGGPGCEDCRRAKRQKLNEEGSTFLQGHSPISDDEGSWWVRKGLKPIDSSKADTPLKSSKQVPKGRQKVVHKTQSLAQLATARIESSQGASTSHVCDNKVNCPHHRSGTEGDKPLDGIKTKHGGDIVSVGKALEKLRIVKKRAITVWLIGVVRQLIEEAEKTTAKVGQFSRPFVPVDDRSSIRWKLGEDELSTILYIVDACGDLVSAAKLIIWLLAKVPFNSTATIHSGRNVMMLPRNVENHACEVGETFLLSSLRRYENTVIATDLVPEVLSAAMRRAGALLSSSGRLSGSSSLVYSRYLLKKYGHLPSILEWEKSFKLTCDKRLISELESGRSIDGDLGFPLGVPSGIEDLDDFLRQKISGNRLSRVGMSMRDVVQRHIDDAYHTLFGKERKLFGSGTAKSSGLEMSDDGYQTAQQIVMGLMDCMRQTGGAAQEGDPSLVSSSVSAIVNSIGATLGKMPDFTPCSNSMNSPSALSPWSYARRILRIHINCLCLLKEALGERQSRVFEIALATEASTTLAAAFAPMKASRSQFQLSPESHDSNANISTEILNNPAKLALGRGTKIAAAISALVIGAIIHGVTSLERIVTLLRLKEGLDVIQYVRSMKSNINGNARSSGAFKVDNSVDIHVHWFRLLVGNCRTLSDGLIVELLGEPSIVALSRMQSLLPQSLVLPPAYCIFAFLTWRPFILTGNLVSRDDVHQLYQSLAMAIVDAIKHLPFRDVCMRDTKGFYDLIATDDRDAEFATILEKNGLDSNFKSKVFVPLRGRLFLSAIIDCKIPQSILTQEDGSWVFGHGGSKVQCAENETKLLDKIVNLLNTLQPAKFHWQWVELRLLLNEQALIEKLETHDISLADAIRSSFPGHEKTVASENENNFIEIILTRLLVRPDAAPLYSELIHLFGRSLDDSMLLQAKWFLAGPDVLFGRKTVRQRLTNIAESKGLSTKAQFWKPWGWPSSGLDHAANRGDKKKFEMLPVEEGEFVEEGLDTKRTEKVSIQFETEGFHFTQQHMTERALIELVVPCIDQGSDDSRNTFASELIKQLNHIEQQINAVTRGASKQTGTTSGMEGPVNKGNNRKGMRGGSPGLARRTTAADSTLPSTAALRASMSLRLQLLLRLLPIICTDGGPSGRNTKHVLSSVILRLLGNRVVYEEAELSFFIMQSSKWKKEMESSLGAASADLFGECLFDRMLLVLHGLLCNNQPSWLKSRPGTKSMNETAKESNGHNHEIVESLQNDLERMQLPSTIRWRIQTAMPILLPSVRCSVSCPPPSVTTNAVSSLQPSIMISGFYPGNHQKNTVSSTSKAATTVPGKSKPLPPQQDNDMEIDPWTLLEDGAGSGPSSSNTAVIASGDHSNLRAASWLRGAVRVRRTDLTYIGTVDDDS